MPKLKIDYKRMRRLINTMGKLKTYRVGVWEECGGYLTVKAESKKEAIEQAEEYINEFGLDAKVDMSHRNTEVFEGDVTLVK